MALKLHNLKPAKGSKKRKKRLGRGNASGKGNYSGRGLKGQKSRSGGKGGLKLRGLKANIKSTPKLGGFKSFKPKLKIVKLQDIDKVFKSNDIITANKLAEKGLINSTRNGVKILSVGKITKKFIIKIHNISDSAIKVIEKAGGKVIILGKTPKKKDKSSERSVVKKIKQKTNKV